MLCTQAGFSCCSFRSSGATPRSTAFARSRRVTNVPVRRTISITDSSPLTANLCISRISSRHLLHSHKPPGVSDAVALVLAELRATILHLAKPCDSPFFRLLFRSFFFLFFYFFYFFLFFWTILKGCGCGWNFGLGFDLSESIVSETKDGIILDFCE